MIGTINPKKTDRGWIIEMPPDMAKAFGVVEGSFAVLYSKDGNIEVDILPPILSDLEASVRATCEEFDEAFREMKRLGD